MVAECRNPNGVEYKNNFIQPLRGCCVAFSASRISFGAIQIKSLRDFSESILQGFGNLEGFRERS